MRVSPEPLRAPARGLHTLESDVDDRDCIVIHSANAVASPAWCRHRRIVGIRHPRYVLTHFARGLDLWCLSSYASYRLGRSMDFFDTFITTTTQEEIVHNFCP